MTASERTDTGFTWAMYDAVTLAHDHYELHRELGQKPGYDPECTTTPLKALAHALYAVLPPRKSTP